jgi:hypothetical protein
MDERRREVLIQLLAASPTRRGALGGGLAALAVLGADRISAQDATPATGDDAPSPLLIQGFSNGTLFPTQGDAADLPPYTLILWDAATAGYLIIDRASGEADVVSAETVLAALETTTDGISGALLAHAQPEGDAASIQERQTWALRLVSGEAGADPGAVTYLGTVLTPTAAEESAASATPPPAGPQNFGAGFLILSGLDVDWVNPDIPRITLP